MQHRPTGSYPRSHLDSDGRFYLLFSTYPAGYPPAGSAAGCRELNLVRNADHKH